MAFTSMRQGKRSVWTQLALVSKDADSPIAAIAKVLLVAFVVVSLCSGCRSVPLFPLDATPSQARAAAESLAKVASFNKVQWAGIFLIGFSLAAFHPWVFLFVRSRKVQLAAAVAGVGFIFVPSLLYGNETLIVCFALAFLVFYFFAQRADHNAPVCRLGELKRESARNGANPSGFG